MVKASKKRARKSAKSSTRRKRSATKKAALPKAAHRAVLASLVAHANLHTKSPVCYNRLSDGSWEICFLQEDGEYAQCSEYNGPAPPHPICG